MTFAPTVPPNASIKLNIEHVGEAPVNFESRAIFTVGDIAYGLSSQSNYLFHKFEQADEHLTTPISMKSSIKKFSVLAATWKEKTLYFSSITEIAMNSSYQSIIGMGKTAIPFILYSLEKEADNWFWALKAITGEDPVIPENRGNIEAMKTTWLKWGKENGFI